MRSVLLLIFAIALFGCRSQKSIVGTWTTRADVGGGTMIFRDDRTFRAVRETPVVTMILDGTYEHKGEALKLQVVKWNVVRGPQLNQKESEEMSTALRKASVSSLRWTDDKHIRITGPNGDLTTAELVTQ